MGKQAFHKGGHLNGQQAWKVLNIITHQRNVNRQIETQYNTINIYQDG